MRDSDTGRSRGSRSTDHVGRRGTGWAAARADDAEKADQEDTEPDEVEVHGVIRRVFPGKLRLRREASFDDRAICGVTMFTEKAVTKKVKIGGKLMYKTLDGYFISGDPAHVKFIPDPECEA